VASFLGLSWKRRKKGGGRRVAWRRELHVEIKHTMVHAPSLVGKRCRKGITPNA
jgi:hypothetical protein